MAGRKIQSSLRSARRRWRGSGSAGATTAAWGLSSWSDICSDVVWGVCSRPGMHWCSYTRYGRLVSGRERGARFLLTPGWMTDSVGSPPCRICLCNPGAPTNGRQSHAPTLTQTIAAGTLRGAVGGLPRERASARARSSTRAKTRQAGTSPRAPWSKVSWPRLAPSCSGSCCLHFARNLAVAPRRQLREDPGA